MELTWPSLLFLGAFAIPVGLIIYHRKVSMYKAKLYAQSVSYLIGSTDMKWPKQPDAEKDFEAALAASPSSPVSKKTFVLLRHGESTWNETFNRGFNPVSFIPRALTSLATEAFLFLTGERDSWFYDSPLTLEGIEQADDFRRFIASGGEGDQSSDRRVAELVAIIRGDDPSRSVLVSSHLRRALSTAGIGLYDRLMRTEEKLLVTSDLQEISRNPDTLCLTAAGLQPVPSWIERAYSALDIAKIYNKNMDMAKNSGNKPVKTHGIERIRKFTDWTFEEAGEAEVVVVSGHSLYFRHYFRTYLGDDVEHAGKTRKIHNGGAVAFDIEQVQAANGKGFVYRIDPNSVVAVYKGFS